MSKGDKPRPLSVSYDEYSRKWDDIFGKKDTTEDITLRVYWDQKDFKKYGNVNIPDGSIMAISNYSDLGKIRKAAFLLVQTAKTGHAQWKFEKAAEPTVHGLNNNYLMSYWKRA